MTPPSPTPAGPAPAVDAPTAADSLFAGFGFVADWVRSLSLVEVAVNAGLSLLVVLIAASVLLLLRWAARAAARRLAHGPSLVRGAAASATLVRLVIGALALLVVLQIWGLDLLAWARGEGAPVVRTALRVTVLAVIFVLAFEAAGVLIERVMGRTAERTRDPRRTAQLETLSPLLRAVVRAVLVLIGAMMLLGEVGVEIGPLLAGAGVLGIAVGFGAQTIVKDLLTGVSLVLEDTVSLGDVVRIGDASGVVESLTMRTIRLRGYDGTLHVIPFSEAQIIHNETKTFSRYVFEISVAYEADIDEALAVMREVGAQLRSDPAFADRILDELEIAGVDKLADSGVVLKARVKTAPGAQWAVGREYQRRIKLALDKAGIEIPFPHLKLVLPAPVAEAVGRA